MSPIIGVIVVAAALSGAAGKAPDKASAQQIEAKAAALKVDFKTILERSEVWQADAAAMSARVAFTKHLAKMALAEFDAKSAIYKVELADAAAKRDAKDQADKVEMARLKKENAELKERLNKAEPKPAAPKP